MFTDLSLQKTNNSIWNDVLKYWCEFNYKPAHHFLRRNEIVATQLWLNSVIRIRDHPVFWKKWYEKNIKIMKDIIDPVTRNFYSWQQIVKKYGVKDNYLNYYSLISAIPLEWKRTLTLRDGDMEVENTIFDNLISCTKPANLIYKQRINALSEQPCDRIDKWNEDMNIVLDEDEWLTLLNDSYKCTNSIQLRSFIYKFAMRDLYPKSRLYKMKIAENTVCIRCNHPNENIMHMFWECPKVKLLWDELNIWLSRVLGINLLTNAPMIMLLEMDVDVTYFPVLALIYTLCKQHIYYNRDNQRPISSISVINMVLRHEKLERSIAISKKRLQKHADKWLGIFQLGQAEQVDH